MPFKFHWQGKKVQLRGCKMPGKKTPSKTQFIVRHLHLEAWKSLSLLHATKLQVKQEKKCYCWENLIVQKNAKSGTCMVAFCSPCHWWKVPAKWARWECTPGTPCGGERRMNGPNWSAGHVDLKENSWILPRRRPGQRRLAGAGLAKQQHPLGRRHETWPREIWLRQMGAKSPSYPF